MPSGSRLPDSWVCWGHGASPPCAEVSSRCGWLQLQETFPPPREKPQALPMKPHGPAGTVMSEGHELKLAAC